MPLYEYECPTHGHMEIQQRITEDALKICPVDSCGQPVRKLISNTSFALKGSGWYATDYGGGTKSTKSEAKTETAPEKKSEAGGCGSAACATGCAGAAAA